MRFRAVVAAARGLVAAAAPLIAERGLTLVGFAVSNIDRHGAQQLELPFEEHADTVALDDAVVAALGGGGLLSGIGSVMRAKKPGVRVYAAEPETAAPFELSLRRGEACYFDGWQPSFVDGAGASDVRSQVSGKDCDVMSHPGG